MRGHHQSIKMGLFIMVIGLVAGLGQAVYAGPLEQVLEPGGWEPASLAGRIMIAEPDKDRIVIMEKEIRLVGEPGMSAVATRIYDLDGDEYGREILQKGSYFFVKGAATVDRTNDMDLIIAKEIYMLPGRLDTEMLQQNEIFTTPSTPW